MYFARRTPFVGREGEMARLRSFLDQPAPFLWWLVTAPGGAGKSRIGLELCLEKAGDGKGWHAGFLAWADKASWSSWQPDRPTLIVVDYAQTRAERLGEVIRTLGRTLGGRRDLRHPVRLLLLERSADRTWLDRLEGGAGETDGVLTREYRHEEPLPLPDLDDEALAEVIAAMAGGKAHLARDAVGLLKGIDPDSRALFAAFLGDALARGEDPRAWDKAALLGHVLQHERSVWRKAGATEEDRNLLMLATLTGGFHLEWYGHPALKPLLDRLPSPEDPQAANRYRAMAGIPAVENVLPGLVPDILGEQFILDHFDTGHLATRETRVRPWLDCAWHLAPWTTWPTLDRMVVDFGNEAGLPAFLHPPAVPGDGAVAWAMLAVNATARLGPTKSETATRVYRDLASLAEKQPGEPALREPQAQAAVNLIHGLGATDPAAARGLYGRLEELARDHPGEPALREAQAQAAVNLINGLGATDPAAARGLYDRLEELARGHPGEPALREAQAKAAFNLILDLGAMEPAAARGLYDQLEELRRNHPGEPALREEQAQAAVNLIRGLGATDPAAARGLYGRLEELARDHPGEPALREEQAKAAVNLIYDLGATDPWAARGLYDRLEELARGHPGELALRENQARAAIVITLYAAGTDDFSVLDGIRPRLGPLKADMARLIEQVGDHLPAELIAGLKNLLALDD
ncbi:hypothetical protein IGS68_11140 [Skermanella sp. TT6]|uniref:Tetratricopeptide repeat protein n=1 Tax=Skermanella cutis TaxID=2775420 RepID=A0ABX7BD93_9PROT|nr:hypothetical protein [Skermanella sp. TT6]QQP91715.1 hypothetical protein IGS68_11140 [Skermanella sp. TT6]